MALASRGSAWHLYLGWRPKSWRPTCHPAPCSWWKEYSDRKNDEEDEHVADSLLYDRNHLPRAAPPPDSVFAERERQKAAQQG